MQRKIILYLINNITKKSGHFHTIIENQLCAKKKLYGSDFCWAHLIISRICSKQWGQCSSSNWRRFYSNNSATAGGVAAAIYLHNAVGFLHHKSPFLNYSRNNKIPLSCMYTKGHIEQEVCGASSLKHCRVAVFCFLCLRVVLWQGMHWCQALITCSSSSLHLFVSGVIYWKRRADMKVLSGTGAKLIMTNYAGVRNWSFYHLPVGWISTLAHTDWIANFTGSPR